MARLAALAAVVAALVALIVVPGGIADRSGGADDDRDDGGGTELAGTVLRFDGTTLALRLTGGGEREGRVDGRTRVDCDPRDAAVRERDDDPGENDDDEPPEPDDREPGGPGDDDPGENDDDEPPEPDDREPGGAGDDDPGDTRDDSAAERREDAADRCSTSVLTPGTAVEEADLVATPGGAAWRDVELTRGG